MRFPGSRRPLSLCAVFLFASVLSGYGATLTVRNLNDSGSGSLRQTIINAASGDTIIFASNVVGTLKLTSGQLAITKTLTINGPGSASLTLSGNSASRHFLITTAAGQLTVSGLTLADGEYYVSTSSNFTTYTAGSGSISNTGGRVELRQCTLTNNLGFREHSGTAYGVSKGGGAISVTGGTLVITDCLFSGNVSNEEGGAIAVDSSNLTITGSTFTQNRSGGYGSTAGGAIYLVGSSVSTITGCAFDGNTADCNGSGEQLHAYGGCIYIEGSDLTLRDSSFVNNSAIAETEFITPYIFLSAQGGAILNDSTSNLLVTNCTFFGNKANTIGGQQGSASSYSFGGAIDDSGTLTMLSCTVVGNSAGTSGGGIGSNQGQIGNTIIAGNKASSGATADVSGAFLSDGYNLIGAVGTATGFTVTGDQTGTASNPLDPKLGAPANNGAPTMTMLPLSGSRALDKGKNFNFAYDQRGLPRTLDNPAVPNASGGDGTDIGAVEAQPVVSAKGDFNDDGYADLVWQNTSTGERTVWFLKNGVYQTGISLPTIGLEWSIAGSADFDGDGCSDLVWQNKNTGERTIWFLKSGVYQKGISLPTIGLQWQIAGAADFDGDGQADLVWQNTSTGERTIWFLKNGVYQKGISLPTIGLEWSIAGADDLNADGNADLVWQNKNTGDRTAWFLKKGVYQTGITLLKVDKVWNVVGVADFNGDGYGDIVFQNTSTGQRSIWLLKKGVYQSTVSLPTIGLQWSIADH